MLQSSSFLPLFHPLWEGYNLVDQEGKSVLRLFLPIPNRGKGFLPFFLPSTFLQCQTKCKKKLLKRRIKCEALVKCVSTYLFLHPCVWKKPSKPVYRQVVPADLPYFLCPQNHQILVQLKAKCLLHISIHITHIFVKRIIYCLQKAAKYFHIHLLEL